MLIHTAFKRDDQLPEALKRRLKMRIAWRLAALIGLGILALPFHPGGATADVTTLKLAHVVSVDGAYHLGAQEFGRLVALKSQGQIRIDIDPGGQKGAGEREILSAMQQGKIDLVVTSTGPVGAIVPRMRVCDLPYLFRNTDHADRVLDGRIGAMLMEDLGGAGIRGIAFWENGFRHLTNGRRAVVTPEDVRGLTIRTMENEIHQAFWRQLGAKAVPMPWGKVYRALKNKTVDGQENPIAIVRTEKIYKVNRYLTLTRHAYSPALLMMDAKRFDSLSAEQQRAILEAGREAAWWERRFVREKEAAMLGELEAAGMVLVTPDRVPFKQAAESVYKTYADVAVSDLVRRIRRVK
jgi:tripartite ATP-independent transporter DctP family solute receptor